MSKEVFRVDTTAGFTFVLEQDMYDFQLKMITNDKTFIAPMSDGFTRESMFENVVYLMLLYFREFYDIDVEY